jgi:hypothetical protein
VSLATGRAIVSGGRSERAREPSHGRIPKVALERMLPRELVREVACPSCGAQPGQLCTGSGGEPRKSNHAARVNLARRASGR